MVSFANLILLGKAQVPACWTRIRNDILGNDSLACRGYEIGIESCIFLAGGTYLKTPKMVATTLEAVVGAVFQDGGDEAVTRVIEHLGFLSHRFLSVMLRCLFPNGMDRCHLSTNNHFIGPLHDWCQMPLHKADSSSLNKRQTFGFVLSCVRLLG
jgi:hypothetical protein